MNALEIPEHSGVIVLPDTVTFPHGAIPLNIFEPRYVGMLEDALETNSMFCVANRHSDETEEFSDCTEKVGVIGFIRASERRDDGCWTLLLHGVRRVEFLSWETDETHSYPKAQIRPLKDISQPSTADTKLIISSLRDATSRFIAPCTAETISRVNKTLDRVTEDLPVLTDVVSQQFITDDSLRQLLLEETNSINRAETLIRHLRTQKISL